MQFELLKAGRLRAPWSPYGEAHPSLRRPSPKFAARSATRLSSVYGFRWFRRFGADNTLAVWALAGTLWRRSSSLVVRRHPRVWAWRRRREHRWTSYPVLIGTFVITVAIGSLFVYERPSMPCCPWRVGVGRRSPAAPGGTRWGPHRPASPTWMTAVRLNWIEVGRASSPGAPLNWLLDCACFAMMFLALGTPDPVERAAARLRRRPTGRLRCPSRPDGLGVVEGSHHRRARGLRHAQPREHRLRRIALPPHQLLDDSGGRLVVHRPARLCRCAGAAGPARPWPARSRPGRRPTGRRPTEVVPGCRPDRLLWPPPSSWPPRSWPRARAPAPTSARTTRRAIWSCPRPPRRWAGTATWRACASTP